MSFVKSKCYFSYGILLAWFILPNVCLAKLQVVGYGESCEHLTNKCDQSKHLFCFDNKCNCSSPETMIYDETAETCAVTKGNLCHQEEFYTETLETYTTDFILASRAVKITRKLPCADGGICTEFLCQDIIHPKVEYDVNNISSLIPCETNKLCPYNTGLNCINGYCKCGLGIQQYYNGTRCVSRVNGACNPAVANPADTRAVNENRLDCTQNAKCIEKDAQLSCQCETGFVSVKNGRCVPDYQQPCDQKKPFCRSEGLLACVNGKCECETEWHVYDTKLKRCRGLVGSSCKFSKDWMSTDERATESLILCVSDAVCDILYQMGQSFSGICKCEEGYVKTTNQTCVKDHNDIMLVYEGTI